MLARFDDRRPTTTRATAAPRPSAESAAVRPLRGSETIYSISAAAIPFEVCCEATPADSDGRDQFAHLPEWFI